MSVGVYRAQIWAVASDGSASGIAGNIAIEDIDDVAWCGLLPRSTSFAARYAPGPVYVWIGRRSAAAELVLRAGDDTAMLYGVGPFE
jgi:hypothetical protein